MELVIVFPHQLFLHHPSLKKDRPVLLVEDPRFFSEFSYHKQKLIFHRASLKHFEKCLKKMGYKTHYIEGDAEDYIKKMRPSSLHMAELDDVRLERKIKSLAKRQKVSVEFLPSPGFLTGFDEFQSLFSGRRHFRFDTFYIYQRKKLDILLDVKGKPFGGKWSMDQENRKRLPKSFPVPEPLRCRPSDEVKEAVSYVMEMYSQNPGDEKGFNYPTTHTGAEKVLRHFLNKSLPFFGDYEDAIVQRESVLFHSCLSPLLNVGLLTPEKVVAETIMHSKKHSIPLNSLEGFIRQVIGWREYVRAVYRAIGEKERRGNFFQHKRKLPSSFYDGTTGIIPIDETIKKLKKCAYVHHIERLMLLGNFFLLCEIDPDEVYKWFMELFIDAYDWVMVPNVYGMSQYADGGMMTTKPYFSSSNYILKMSDYPRGEWCRIWDALFWRFMIKHDKFFETQSRLGVLYKMAQKKKHDCALMGLAENFLEGLK